MEPTRSWSHAQPWVLLSRVFERLINRPFEFLAVCIKNSAKSGTVLSLSMAEASAQFNNQELLNEAFFDIVDTGYIGFGCRICRAERERENPPDQFCKGRFDRTSCRRLQSYVERFRRQSPGHTDAR